MKSALNVLFWLVGWVALFTLTGKSIFCQTPKELSRSIQFKKLENGLRVFLIEDSSAPTFSYQTWYQVGSAEEQTGQTGLAHLLEHMMFKETKNLKTGQFDALLEAAGVENKNAFTTQDVTVYYQELPSQQLELIIQLESERMRQLQLSAEALSTEKKVIHEERRMRYENNPTGLLRQTLVSLLFPKGHPYHAPVIGYTQDLEALSVDSLIHFYDTFYQPERAILVIVGDVQAERTWPLIEKAYGHFSKKISEKSPIVSTKQKNDLLENGPHTKTKELITPTATTQIMIGYPIPSVKDPIFPAFVLLETLLSTGKAAALYQTFVRSGITSKAQAVLQEKNRGSFFLLWMELQQHITPKTALKQWENFLKKKQSQLFTPDEIRRAKNQLKRAFYEAWESQAGKAHFLGQWASLTGDPAFGFEVYQKAQHVTGKDLRLIFSNVLKKEKAHTVIVKPTAEIAEKKTASIAEQVLFIDSEPQTELVHLHLLVPQGYADDCVSKDNIHLEKWPGLTRFMTELLLKGTQNRSQMELSERLERLGAHLSIEVKMESTEIKASVLQPQLSPFLSLLREILTSPAFLDSEQDLLKQETQAAWNARFNYDAGLAQEFFVKALFYPHPYSCQAMASPLVLSQINTAIIRQRYQEWFQPHTFSMAATGKSTRQALKNWMQELTQDLRQINIAQQNWKKKQDNRVPLPKKQRWILVDKPERTQVQVILGQTGLPVQDPSLPEWILLNHALGGSGFFSSLLNQEIRIKEGWSYGIRSSFQWAKEPFLWQIHFATHPEKAALAIQKVMTLISQLRSQGISQEVWELAKKSLIAHHGFLRNTPLKRLAITLWERGLGLPTGWTAQLEQRLSGVSHESSRKALHDFLDPEKWVLVILGTAEHLQRDFIKYFPSVTLERFSFRDPFPLQH